MLSRIAVLFMGVLGVLGAWGVSGGRGESRRMDRLSTAR